MPRLWPHVNQGLNSCVGLPQTVQHTHHRNFTLSPSMHQVHFQCEPLTLNSVLAGVVPVRLCQSIFEPIQRLMWLSPLNFTLTNLSSLVISVPSTPYSKQHAGGPPRLQPRMSTGDWPLPPGPSNSSLSDGAHAIINTVMINSHAAAVFSRVWAIIVKPPVVFALKGLFRSEADPLRRVAF